MKYYRREVDMMDEKDKIWSKKKSHTSLNPQGLSEDESNNQPKSQLEQRIKKKNTKV